MVTPFRQTPEQHLLCPIYLGWGREGATEVPTAAIPPHGEATLDKVGTRKQRAAGAAEACCYHWYATCPAPKPPGG